jgi:hypothetical protein
VSNDMRGLSRLENWEGLGTKWSWHLPEESEDIYEMRRVVGILAQVRHCSS